MDPEKLKQISQKGGQAAHAKGTAHEFSSDEAKLAGKKGGAAVSSDRGHMAAIGRAGGKARKARRTAESTKPTQESQ
jgi:general stress protein YciG